MNTTSLRSRFRGVLLGVAVGDALGAPFEGNAHVSPNSVNLLTTQPHDLRYTDDTHMTIGMAESLLSRRGFDGAHMAETFARNFDAEPWRGYGPGPPLVFRALRQGVAWDEAGPMLFGGSGSFGNGAAMRVAPAALYAFADLDCVEWLARQTARITHAHELGTDGAAIQACAIARLVATPVEEELDPHEFLSELILRARSDAFRFAIERVGSLSPNAHPAIVANALGNGVEAHRSVPAALYWFLSSRKSLPNAVCGAIAMGGDTDTIASMAGALSGAWLGEEAIHESWQTKLENAEQLRRFADGLLQLVDDGEPSD
ncbi:MAG: ADP-ribosylglycohydrolase family protein [Pirellulales bacterium]